MYKWIKTFIIPLFILGFPLVIKAELQEHPVTFTQPDSDKMIKFEKEIAYFYGAKNPERIAKHYIKAILELEKLGVQAGDALLEKAMFSPLKEAYAEVKAQTHLKFNIDKAAKYEFQVILNQARKASFEKNYQSLINLYKEIFHSEELGIHRGAMLRTFLYEYKLSLLKARKTLSNDDLALMLSIAKASEKELNNLNKCCIENMDNVLDLKRAKK